MKDLTLWAKDLTILTDAVKAAGLWDTETDSYQSASHNWALCIAGPQYRYERIDSETVNAKQLEGVWGMFRIVEWTPEVDLILKYFNAAGIISDPLAEMPIEWCGGNEKITRYDSGKLELKTITLAESVTAVKLEKYAVADVKAALVEEVLKPK